MGVYLKNQIEATYSLYERNVEHFDNKPFFYTGHPVVLIKKNNKYVYINFSQSTTILLVYIMFIIYNIPATSFGFMPSLGPL